jgi:hypothetical protein
VILGLLAIAIVWAALGYVYSLTKESDLPTLSQLALTSRKTRSIYTAALIISGTMFYIFLTGWFAQTLGLGSKFVVLVGAAVLLQIITALVPYRGKWSKVHGAAIYSESILLIPIAGMVAAGSRSRLVQIIFIAMIVILGWALAYTFFLPRKRSFLLLQASYAFSFHLLIIVATFIGLASLN